MTCASRSPIVTSFPPPAPPHRYHLKSRHLSSCLLNSRRPCLLLFLCPSAGTERGDGPLRAPGMVPVRRIRGAGARICPPVSVSNTRQVCKMNSFFFLIFCVSLGEASCLPQELTLLFLEQRALDDCENAPCVSARCSCSTLGVPVGWECVYLFGSWKLHSLACFPDGALFSGRAVLLYVDASPRIQIRPCIGTPVW